MKIFVIGASGRVGSKIMADLKLAGHQVSGSYNRASNARQGLVKLDLHDSVDINREKLRGFDVIYFAAGSGGEDMIQVDLMGLLKSCRLPKMLA
jgi:putative NADH-flavin reductase